MDRTLTGGDVADGSRLRAMFSQLTFHSSHLTLSVMSWEAHRLTSKSPAEVYAVLGPHGCDDLLRQAWAACWREMPEEGRTFQSVRQRFFEVFTRNLNIWKRIKKPTPEAFFADFKPHDTAEGHIR